jgi:hypothetical protein
MKLHGRLLGLTFTTQRTATREENNSFFYAVAKHEQQNQIKGIQIRFND